MQTFIEAYNAQSSADVEIKADHPEWYMGFICNAGQMWKPQIPFVLRTEAT